MPRGYGPPPPGYFPRGLRPPFPGAVPRFGRHPPPFAFRGRPPMGFMRYPRGMYMRHPRPPHYQAQEEEEEDESMTEEKKEDSDGGSGPKSLMSIKTPKEIRESVKNQILAKGPLLHAPLGMGMGPRFHLRGMRPPPPGAPLLPQPPPPTPQGPPSSAPSARGGRGGHSQEHQRGSLKRPASGATPYDGPRPKMMAQPPPSMPSSVSRTNLRQIQTVDEPMHQAPPSQPHYRPRLPHNPLNTGRGGFTVSHKPAPSLTQIRTVDSSHNAAPKPAQQQQNR